MKKTLFILTIVLVSGCNVLPSNKSEQIVKPDVIQTIRPTPEKIYQSALEFYNKSYFIQASQAFLKAAQQNHAKSQFRLARMYYDGKGIDNNYSAEAAKWYKKAAEQGHIEAQYFLGALYFVGSGGIAQSFSKARQWYYKAAKQGHIEAQLSLGMMHYNGKGVKKDITETKKWLSLAAAQGNEDADLMLQKPELNQ